MLARVPMAHGPAAAYYLGEFAGRTRGCRGRRLSGLRLNARSSAGPVRVSSAMSAKPEIVTAGLLVIGDEILSGRTKDKNIGYIADYLTAIGIDLKEVRVISDDETAIVSALNALRSTYDYVFTTGGIGPDARRHHRRLRGQGLRRGAALSPRRGGDPEGAHGQDRRRAQRGAPAHGAHTRGRAAHRQQGVGRARLLDRQCDRNGGCALGHAVDARRGGAETEDRRQADLGHHPRRRQGRRCRHRAWAPSQRRIRRRSSAAIRSSTRSSGPIPISWCARAIRTSSRL